MGLGLTNYTIPFTGIYPNATQVVEEQYIETNVRNGPEVVRCAVLDI